VTSSNPLSTGSRAESRSKDRVTARSSNLRLRREFTDRDRDVFLEESFRYIQQFFENSLTELEHRNGAVETRLLSRSNTRFTAAIYVEGKKQAACTVWFGNESGLSEGICYAHGDSSSRSGFNECFTVETSGYSLSLKPLG
jgi:hypothetical protein